MAGGGVDDGSTYSPMVGGMYIFNLIVGAGALAMPKAFGESGYIGGVIMIGVLAACSYITITFMVEAMAIGNAFLRHKKKTKTVQSDTSPLMLDEGEDEQPQGIYTISRRTEMADLAQQFFPGWGVKLFYLCIIIYLYGDLCIYVVAVPKSLQSVVCGDNVSMSKACLGDHVNTHHSYYLFLTFFAVLIGPFCFFNVQKTKWLQIFTTFMRWTTFLLMTIIAIYGLATGKTFTSSDRIPKPSQVPKFDIKGLPVLFGVSIYSFMCHHSLPSLVTPISNKARLGRLFVSDIGMIFGFYCLLCLTAIFRFKADVLQDLYTLNFEHFNSSFVAYFLALFPVITLSANFPIIAITLRNNLRALLISENKRYPSWITKIGLPLLAIGPPIIVGYFTEDVGFLVSFTGSYAGVGIQYLVPALLCLCARKKAFETFGYTKNPHRSIFGKYAIYGMVGWSFACIGVVTFNHIYTKK